MTDPLFPHPFTTPAELHRLRRSAPSSPERRASWLRVLREPLTREAATLMLTMSAADLSAAMVALRGELARRHQRT